MPTQPATTAIAPAAPAATQPRQRLTPAGLAQAESFIAKHEPDAFPPVRAAAGPLHAVGDRVMATFVGEVTAVCVGGDDQLYRVRFQTLDGLVWYVAVPAFRLSAMEG